MDTAIFAVWILAAMNYLVPQRDHSVLAQALAEHLIAAHEETSAPTLYMIAATEIAVMYRESTLDNEAIGDNGTSYGIGQINLPGATRTREGWSGADILGNDPMHITRAIVIVDRMVSESMRVCRSLPLEERLAEYARGLCASERGRKISRDRMWLSKRLLAIVVVHPDDNDGEVETFDVLP